MKTHAAIGDWVQIKQVVLPVGERAPQVPEDTKNTPFLLWVKGFAQQEANIGETMHIQTVTGRALEGELVAVEPGYTYGFGNCVPELLAVDNQLRELMRGEQ